MKKYNVLIKDSEDEIFNYAYTIECEEDILFETLFNNAKDENIAEGEDISNESILDKMVKNGDIKSYTNFVYDLIITN